MDHRYHSGRLTSKLRESFLRSTLLAARWQDLQPLDCSGIVGFGKNEHHYLMKNIQQAVKRIEVAIQKNQNSTIN